MSKQFCDDFIKSQNLPSNDRIALRKWMIQNHPDRKPENKDKYDFNLIKQCVQDDRLVPYISSEGNEIVPYIPSEGNEMVLYKPPSQRVERPFSPTIYSTTISERFRRQIPLSCPKNRVYRTGYVTKNGTEVAELCAKKRRKSKSTGRKKKKTPKRKSRSCSPRKFRRKSHSRKGGIKVKSTCVRRRRRS